ncbi:MAG: Omp28-related outer membrane protein [Bacteroidales bacterium]|nr:Omp28-related outer membrane protein [Bacteroidales bacterium]
MKKILLLATVVLMTISGVLAQSEQFVSTAVSNKNVVLEEFTGINCGYCPDGHKRANQVAAAHPGRVFVINIHAGNYAANTYTTLFGEALANQTGLTGYPSGTVNRHIFSGSHTALDRGSWSSAANTILSQTSPVNIAARGTLDWSTRELNITVQLYYTSNEINSTNKLNVAIIQDNVIGSQSGSSLNPDQVVGSQYRHMHMLRHFLSGQWGESVSPTTSGSFIEKTYTYTIPASLGTPNAIQAKLEDLHFIAFVSQSNQEILTGCEVEIENINLPALSPRLDGLKQKADALKGCNLENTVLATVTNAGSDPLTTLTFEYNVANGAAHTYTWTGNIASLTKQDIELPAFVISPNVNQNVKAHLTSANGQTVNGAEVQLATKKYVANLSGNATILIKTDEYASETSYKLYGPNNNIIQQSSNLSASTENSFAFNPTDPGCYRLEVLDSYGDGISGGYVRIKDANNSLITSVPGSSINDKVIININFGNVGIEDVTVDENISIYPNPTHDIINIATDLNIQQVEVYNMQGQRVAAEMGNVNSISLNGLANGLYLLKVTTENGVSTYKVNKK